MNKIVATVGIMLNTLAFHANAQQTTKPSSDKTASLAEMVIQYIQESPGTPMVANEGTAFTMMGGNVATSTGNSREYMIMLNSKADKGPPGVDAYDVNDGTIWYYNTDNKNRLNVSTYNVDKDEKGFKLYSTITKDGKLMNDRVIGEAKDIESLIKAVGKITSQKPAVPHNNI